MKKPWIPLIVLLIWAVPSHGQDTANRVTYMLSRQDNDYTPPDESEAESAMDLQAIRNVAQLEEAMKEVRFELYFNAHESLYRVKEVLIPEENRRDKMAYTMAAMVGGIPGDLYYRNLADSTEVVYKERQGERFLVEYPFDRDQWTVSGETKTILRHLCRKATTHRSEWDYFRDKQLDFDIEVWFTTDYPLSFGPKGLVGLPGLVLEASITPILNLVATKLETDVSIKKNLLSEPAKGKRVSADEFSRISAKMTPGRRN